MNMSTFKIAIFGFFLLITLASGSKCPQEDAAKLLVCYYKSEVSLSNFNICSCTHVVFTNALKKGENNSLSFNEGVKRNLDSIKKRKDDVLALFTLEVKSNDASAILKSENKSNELISDVEGLLLESNFAGVELNFKFGPEDGVTKESYGLFVKKLSKALSFSRKRVKRDGYDVFEKLQDDVTTAAYTTQTPKNSTSRTQSINRQDKAKSRNTRDDKDKISLKEAINKEFSPENQISKSATSENKFLIFLRLSIDPEIIAKKFDLKLLGRYSDVLLVPTHDIVNKYEEHLTYHPSRLMGLSDMLNTDSVLDFLTGIGAPKSKIVITLPLSVLKFQLKDVSKNTPRSPTSTKPQIINQSQLCSLLSKSKNWTVERDDDLTAPYAYSGKTWLAFEDETSVGIKGKYVLLRELAGGAVYPIDADVNDGSCTNRTRSGSLIEILHENFQNLGRKPRALVLENLQEEIHSTGFSGIEAGVRHSEYRIVRVVDHSGAVHVIRRNTKTQFECSRQGYFSHPLGCNKFYRCVKFDQYSDEFTVFEYDCPAGLAFDERWEVCVWPGSLPHGAPCTGSSEIAPVPRSHYRCPDKEGYYADVENCRWFFACLDHARDGVTPLTAYEFRCPFGLVFNEERLACDWPWLVGACGNRGAAGFLKTTFINGGNLAASSGQYTSLEQGATFHGFGLRGNSQTAGFGYIGSGIDDKENRASFGSFPDYEISGGRIFNKEGLVLGQHIVGLDTGKQSGFLYHRNSQSSYGQGSISTSPAENEYTGHSTIAADNLLAEYGQKDSYRGDASFQDAIATPKPFSVNLSQVQINQEAHVGRANSLAGGFGQREGKVSFATSPSVSPIAFTTSSTFSGNKGVLTVTPKPDVQTFEYTSSHGSQGLALKESVDVQPGVSISTSPSPLIHSQDYGVHGLSEHSVDVQPGVFISTTSRPSSQVSSHGSQGFSFQQAGVSVNTSPRPVHTSSLGLKQSVDVQPGVSISTSTSPLIHSQDFGVQGLSQQSVHVQPGISVSSIPRPTIYTSSRGSQGLSLQHTVDVQPEISISTTPRSSIHTSSHGVQTNNAQGLLLQQAVDVQPGISVSGTPKPSIHSFGVETHNTQGLFLQQGGDVQPGVSVGTSPRPSIQTSSLGVQQAVDVQPAVSISTSSRPLIHSSSYGSQDYGTQHSIDVQPGISVSSRPSSHISSHGSQGLSFQQAVDVQPGVSISTTPRPLLHTSSLGLKSSVNVQPGVSISSRPSSHISSFGSQSFSFKQADDVQPRVPVGISPRPSIYTSSFGLQQAVDVQPAVSVSATPKPSIHSFGVETHNTQGLLLQQGVDVQPGVSISTSPRPSVHTSSFGLQQAVDVQPAVSVSATPKPSIHSFGVETHNTQGLLLQQGVDVQPGVSISTSPRPSVHTSSFGLKSSVNVQPGVSISVTPNPSIHGFGIQGHNTQGLSFQQSVDVQPEISISTTPTPSTKYSEHAGFSSSAAFNKPIAVNIPTPQPEAHGFGQNLGQSVHINPPHFKSISGQYSSDGNVDISGNFEYNKVHFSTPSQPEEISVNTPRVFEYSHGIQTAGHGVFGQKFNPQPKVTKSFATPAVEYSNVAITPSTTSTSKEYVVPFGRPNQNSNSVIGGYTIQQTNPVDVLSTPSDVHGPIISTTLKSLINNHPAVSVVSFGNSNGDTVSSTLKPAVGFKSGKGFEEKKIVPFASTLEPPYASISQTVSGYSAGHTVQPQSFGYASTGQQQNIVPFSTLKPENFKSFSVGQSHVTPGITQKEQKAAVVSSGLFKPVFNPSQKVSNEININKETAGAQEILSEITIEQQPVVSINFDSPKTDKIVPFKSAGIQQFEYKPREKLAELEIAKSIELNPNEFFQSKPIVVQQSFGNSKIQTPAPISYSTVKTTISDEIDITSGLFKPNPEQKQYTFDSRRIKPAVQQQPDFGHQNITRFSLNPNIAIPEPPQEYLAQYTTPSTKSKYVRVGSYEGGSQRPKSRGRQYHGGITSNLKATNKYEEYDINGKARSDGKTTIDLTNLKVDKDKKTVIVVSQVSDANPLLIGKLAGQCSCQSNVVELKPKAKNRKTAQITNEFLPPIDGETTPQPVSSTILSSLSPDGVLTITPKSVYAGSLKKRQYRGKARYLPPTDLLSAVPASEIASTVDYPSGQNEIDDVRAGAAFDRYGPGGWRSYDETLQGSVDCKRPGLFRHPKYCNKFYSCNYDPWKERFVLHVFNCPIHLAYDASISACNWPVRGPACADDNLLV